MRQIILITLTLVLFITCGFAQPELTFSLERVTVDKRYNGIEIRGKGGDVFYEDYIKIYRDSIVWDKDYSHLGLGRSSSSWEIKNQEVITDYPNKLTEIEFRTYPKHPETGILTHNLNTNEAALLVIRKKKFAIMFTGRAL